MSFPPASLLDGPIKEVPCAVSVSRHIPPRFQGGGQARYDFSSGPASASATSTISSIDLSPVAPCQFSSPIHHERM
ncbi:hypothetical protein K2D_08910 [Planctomycetes bacterium K2D]|uniref:Uncharacterized protein n=1 Tax=Botrimarina mediterranea TaxID=2528022 RepID=A0A518K4M8_9BACT|nr:hypothetical protein Spa11_09090 [Botrimarina mediterranea]QDV77300.1 hypothetical protein K2D_08910 [Planctomycetes bacterium K2D]